MTGIFISVDPVLFTTGPLSIRWYGLFVGLALCAGYYVFLRQIRSKGLPADEVAGSFPWLIAAGFVGARLFHVLDSWSYYSEHPLNIINLQQGGLAIWGGILCGSAAAALIFYSKGLPLAKIADAAVPALLVGQIIGRLGCIINGDAYGGMTELPWGFVYTHPDSLIPDNLRGVSTHPYPVYEMVWNGVCLALLLSLRRFIFRNGRLFIAYLALYSVGRFILSSTRQENYIFGYLQQAQVLGILVLMLTLGIWIILRRNEITH